MLRDLLNNNVLSLVGSGAPVNGASGTGAGFAGPGSEYTDTVAGNYYINTNTIASPTWALQLSTGLTGDVTTSAAGVTSIGAGRILESMVQAASAIGLGLVRFAKATYDFAVDGGAISTITFVSNATIPINAIIIGGIIDVLTPATTGTSGTMAIGTSAGSSTSSIKGALAAASYTGLVATVPVFSAATAVKMTAAGSITGTIATGTFTAGKFNIILAYLVGN